jgi:hypothetical protein
MTHLAEGQFFERWTNVKQRKSGRFRVSNRRPVMFMEDGQNLEPFFPKIRTSGPKIPSNYCCLSYKVHKLRN